MIRYGLILSMSLIFLLMPAAGALAEPPEHYLDFAHSLFQEGDYYRAVTEARRFLFLSPDHPKRFEAYLLIGRSYFRMGEYGQAREFLHKAAYQRELPDLAETALWELGRCLELSDRAGAAAYYRDLIENPPLTEADSADLRSKAGLKLGWLLLEDGKWDESSRAFLGIADDHPLSGQAGILAGEALHGRDLPYVSPQTAGILSAVLPGAGQLYSKRPTDAALAFGLNAAFLWGTVEAYQDESWAVFTLLGFMEVALYGGNIYNAVNGAHIRNEEVRRNFIEKLKRDHHWSLGYSPRQKAPFLALTIRY